MSYSKFIPEGYYELTAHCFEHDEPLDIALVRSDSLDFRMDVEVHPCPKCLSSAGKEVWVVIEARMDCEEPVSLVGIYSSEERAREEAERAGEDYRTADAQWHRGVYYPDFPWAGVTYHVQRYRIEE